MYLVNFIKNKDLVLIKKELGLLCMISIYKILIAIFVLRKLCI